MTSWWDFALAVFLTTLAWGKSVPTIALALIVFFIYIWFRWTLGKTREDAPQEGNEFRVYDGRDALSADSVELDADINHRPLKNHFLFVHRLDTSRSNSEYEYRIDGTTVETRLLHSWYEDIGVEKHFDTRDGVFLEADFRERSKKQTFFAPSDIEKQIVDRRKALEWCEVSSISCNGLKYFILYNNLAPPEARRFFRQEIERLKLGSNRFIEAGCKIGFVHDESSEWRLRLPENVAPGDEERKNLTESIPAFGLASYNEFVTAPKLIADLEKYLA